MDPALVLDLDERRPQVRELGARVVVALARGVREEALRLARVLRDAAGAVEVEVREVVLGLGVAAARCVPVKSWGGQFCCLAAPVRARRRSTQCSSGRSSGIALVYKGRSWQRPQNTSKPRRACFLVSYRR